MNNPFDELLQEIREIKAMLDLSRSAPEQQVEIINRAELMKRLGITEPTAIRWGRRGVIPEMKIGTNVRYNWPSVISSLEKKRK